MGHRIESEDCLPSSVDRAGEPPRPAGPLPTVFPASVPSWRPGQPPRLPARTVPPSPTWVCGPLPAGPATWVARAALAHLGSARTLQAPGSAAPPRRVPDDVTEAGGAVPTGAGWGPDTSGSLSLFFLTLLSSPLLLAPSLPLSSFPVFSPLSFAPSPPLPLPSLTLFWYSET